MKTGIIKVCYIVAIILVVLGGTIEIFLNEPRTISINKLEQINELSTVGEVWIDEIKLDNAVLDLTDIRVPAGWEYRDGAIFTDNPDSEALIIDMQTASKVTIVFRKHTWAGMVQIDWLNKAEVIDLYNSEYITEEVNISSTKLKLIASKIILIGIFIGLVSVANSFIGNDDFS